MRLKVQERRVTNDLKGRKYARGRRREKERKVREHARERERRERMKEN
jgi:hypothetical protein